MDREAEPHVDTGARAPAERMGGAHESSFRTELPSARRIGHRCRHRCRCGIPEVDLQERPEPRDPLVDLRLVDEAEREAHRVGAAPVGVEERAGHDPDLPLHRPAGELGRVDARQAASARRRSRPVDESSSLRRGGSPRARRAAARACRGRRPRPGQLLVDPPASVRLLEQALAERAGALIRVLLGGDELRGDVGRPGRPAEAHAGEERLRGGARLEDDVRAEAPEARRRVGSKPSSR